MRHIEFSGSMSIIIVTIITILTIAGKIALITYCHSYCDCYDSHCYYYYYFLLVVLLPLLLKLLLLQCLCQLLLVNIAAIRLGDLPCGSPFQPLSSLKLPGTRVETTLSAHS